MRSNLIVQSSTGGLGQSKTKVTWTDLVLMKIRRNEKSTYFIPLGSFLAKTVGTLTGACLGAGGRVVTRAL